jgi:hypothetical protein
MAKVLLSTADKLNYILEEYMSASDVTRAFGFKSDTMISNMRNGKANMATLHLEGLEKHFNIPREVFNYQVNDSATLDSVIKAYRIRQEAKQNKERIQQIIIEKLELEELIPKGLFNKVFQKEETLLKLIDEHKKSLNHNTSSSLLKYIEKAFPKNEKLFEKLKGVWYAYLYPSNLSSAEHGIWEVKTTINDDYSVVDYWGNKGYLKLGKQESMIVKHSYDNDDLTIIRFVNRQVPSSHFRFVIISNQNNTFNEMVNFGFFSRKQYSPDEAKEILGDIDTKQLKLDLDFNDRLNERAIVPQ